IELCEQTEESADDCFIVTVDQPGDFSTYTLSVIELDDEGNAHPFPGFDQRYYQLDFTFKANCPSDLDCKTAPACPTPAPLEPDINYLAKDYASFRQLLLDRLAQTMPDWKERHVPDLGIALIETLAYVGDHLSYHQDAVATEAYLSTARQRISVRRHARLVDYLVHEGCNARAWVAVAASQDQALEAAKLQFITTFPNAPAPGAIIAPVDLLPVNASSYEVFLPLYWNADEHDPEKAKLITFYPTHNVIHFYTWDDRECCLPRGATSATLFGQLADESQEPFPTEPARQLQETPLLHLKAGDVLIFEEVIGPKTGDPDDANPNHRHAVRLTKVEAGFDALHDPPRPVVEIAWAQEEALPFPLCISAIGPAPLCRLIENI
ncbi:MAG: putative baseplate assembly protein, partial [bacterium]